LKLLSKPLNHVDLFNIFDIYVLQRVAMHFVRYL